MEENLENFVNLLNHYRQHRPVPKELSRLPSWAQRELSKRPPEPPQRQDALQLNGTSNEDKPKLDIVVASQPAATPHQAIIATPEAPSQRRVDPSHDKPKVAAPVDKVETSAPALDPIDPRRDPEAWLARFLSDEGDNLVHGRAISTTASAKEKKGAEKVEQIETGSSAAEQSKAAAGEPDKKIAGEKKVETPLRTEQTTSARQSSVATELIPLRPVIVTRMGSARRIPVAYGLPAAAAIAVIAIGVGGYWLVQSKARLVADIKTIGPAPTAMPTAKPSPIVARTVAPQQRKAQVTEMKPAPAAAQPVAIAKPVAAPNSQVKMAEAVTAVLALASTSTAAPKSEMRADRPQRKIVGTQSTGAVRPPATRPLATTPQTETGTSHPIAATTSAPPAPSPPKTASVAAPRDTSQLAMLLTAPVLTTDKNGAMPTQSEPQSAVAPGEEPTWQRNAIPAPPFKGQPQIAIVIDDLGLDRNRTERAIALKGPITLSFLAYASDLPEQTEAARRAGHELVVHVPMEPILRPKLVTQTASSADPPHAEILRRLRWDLSRFSGYVGVDNHLGNRLSTDPGSTAAVIDELKARGLVFLDSRSSGSSPLTDAARKGVPTVTRDVLLDDDVTVSSVSDRLSQLEAIARQRGTAIAVGHPHDLTLDALKVWIASLPGKGLQLVPLTAIVRDREQREVGAD
jgi:uncharacterized protein